jgi:hypothetical protein
MGRGGSSMTWVHGMEKANSPARRRGKSLPQNGYPLEWDMGGSASYKDKNRNRRPAPTQQRLAIDL